MIELSIDAVGLTRMEHSILTLRRDQLPFAMARALNDTAKAATIAVNLAMAEVFDRPNKFTERASIAPRAMAATKTRPMAEITMRPIQGQYLALEETGGTRTGAMNTRKPSRKIMLPAKALELDQYGGIPRGTLARFNAAAAKSAGLKQRRAKAAASAPAQFVFLPANDPGNKAGISGWFRRDDGHHLVRLTAFESQTHYHARMGYHARVEAAARTAWPSAFRARLHEAIATAR